MCGITFLVRPRVRDTPIARFTGCLGVCVLIKDIGRRLSLGITE